MKTINYFLTVLFISILSHFSAQNNHINYDRDTKWNFGLNAGATWQEKELDFINKPGFSGGLTLGRAIYEKEERLLSFDLRGRLLGGQTTGWSSAASHDSTLFSRHTGGYGFKNYRFEYVEGALELVVNAHRLRERTGVLLYAFGGVGLVSHSVRHNYMSGNDPYDYTSIDTTASKTAIANQLKQNFNDYSWDKGNKFFDGTQTLFMPSLGLGLGYQVTPKLSIGVEHKVTFGLNDNLDGELDGKNDRYHYTNFNIRWNLFKGNNNGGSSYIPEERPTPNPNVPIGNNNPSNNGEVGDYSTPTESTPGNKPLVNITRPANNGGKVYTSNYNVKAKVYYVDGKSNIVFKHNGITINNFTYNSSTKLLNANITLLPGVNTFVITATNLDGSDTDSKTINLDKVCKKPTITFTKPVNNGKVLTVSTTTIKATILNISNRNMIIFKHNGSSSNNFSFNTTTKVFSATVNCNSGNNIFEIEANNDCGSKTNTRTIIFNKPIFNGPPPLVTITNPSNSPYITTTNQFNIGATILNINTPSQIQFKVNGVINHAYSYNGNTKIFNANINLQLGNNVIDIKATNNYGIDEKTTVIIKKQTEQIPPPVVSITYPTINPFTTNSNLSVVNGTVHNINSANQIQVSINGLNSNNFTYDLNTKKISLTANLTLGSNTITIRATNSTGTDAKSTTIIYKKQAIVQPPVVSYTYPSSSPVTVTSNNITVNARVLNVNAANQIQITHNGSIVPAFNFNTVTKEVTINRNLILGSNIFNVKGTNQAGSDQKQTIVVYKKQVIVQPPVVNYTYPNSSPVTVTSNNITINARVLNVNTANQIQVTHNGASIPNFNFNTVTKEVTINRNLILGSNIFNVKGTNQAGSDQKQTIVVYKKQVIVQPPVVSYISPSTSPTNVSSSSITINAKVLNVNTANQIQTTHNGVIIPAFNFNTVTKELVISRNLIFGNNIFNIKGTNQAGSDQKQTIIIYKKKIIVEPPVVTILIPNSTPFNTSNANEIIKARINNISSRSQTSLNFNGVNINNFNFNGATKTVTFNASLLTGTNTLIISANNSAGADSKTQTIIKSLPCIAPTLALQIPNQSPHNHVGRSGNMAFTFSSSNIISKNQITVKGNGYDIPFNLEQSNGNIWGTIPLKVGANLLKVLVKNECGQATKEIQVLYKGNTSKLVPPVITIQTPSSFPYTTTNSNVTVLGKVINVSSQNNIQVTIDGSNTNFSFNTATKLLTIPTVLTIGSHQVRVRANNNYGNDMEVFDLIRTGPQIKAPIIKYNNLGTSNSYRNPFISPQRSYTVQGNVINSQNATVTVYVNGSRLSNYSYNASTGAFSIPISFSLQGQGTQRRTEVEVRASNSAGQAAKKGHLVYVIQNISTNPNVNTKPNNNTNTLYNEYIKKGNNYYNQGKLTLAKSYYEKAAKTKPKENFPKQKLQEITQKLKVKKTEEAKPTAPKVIKPSAKTVKPIAKPSTEKKEINSWTTKPIQKP